MECLQSNGEIFLCFERQVVKIFKNDVFRKVNRLERGYDVIYVRRI